MLTRLGEIVFSDGGLCNWIRHPHDYQNVTVRRDQLYIIERHLKAYAAALQQSTAAVVVAPAPGAAIATPPTPWRINEPTRYTGYRHELFIELKRQLAAGAPLPSGYQILDTWRTKPPIGFIVGSDKFTYPTHSGKRQSKSVSVRSLQRSIDGLCKAK